MLGVAWVLAIATATPQLFLWTLARPAPNFVQCVSFWVPPSLSGLCPVVESDGDCGQAVDGNYAKFPLSMRVYNGVHLLLLFWLPAAALVTLYALLARLLYRALCVDAAHAHSAHNASSLNVTSDRDPAQPTEETSQVHQSPFTTPFATPLHSCNVELRTSLLQFRPKSSSRTSDSSGRSIFQRRQVGLMLHSPWV